MRRLENLRNLCADHRISFNEIGRFDSALQTQPSKESPNRDDVLLVISLRHKRDFFGPIDECEDRCLDEMRKALREVGAQEESWSESRAHTRFHEYQHGVK